MLMAAAFSSPGRASTTGLTSTSVMPPPMASRMMEIVRPTYGGRRKGSVVRPRRPTAVQSCPAIMQARYPIRSASLMETRSTQICVTKLARISRPSIS